MFENIVNFFKRFGKNDKENSSIAAKERLHLVLAQDRANISADFLEMMKQEIIDVIKKYIDIDEEAMDVRMTNKPSEDGIVGAPALYANIPILTIKNDARKLEGIFINKDKEILEVEKKEELNIKKEKEESIKENEKEKNTGIQFENKETSSTDTKKRRKIEEDTIKNKEKDLKRNLFNEKSKTDKKQGAKVEKNIESKKSLNKKSNNKKKK